MPASAGPAEHSGDTGSIQGFVLDEELVSIAGATILLIPGNHETTSAQDGSFSYSRIAPGSYTLVASRIGYASATGAIAVEPGQSARKDLTMARLTLYEPATEIIGPFEGYMECRYSFGTIPFAFGANGPCGSFFVLGQPVTALSELLWKNDKISMFFNLSRPDWHDIILEAKWQGGTVFTNPDMDMIFSYANRTPSHRFGSSGAHASPIKFNFTRNVGASNAQLPETEPVEPSNNFTLRTWLTVPYSNVLPPLPVALYQPTVALDLHFQLYVTVFYSQKAPESYSAFG